MALHDVTIRAVYDDVKKEVALQFDAPTQPAPPTLPAGHLWRPLSAGMRVNAVLSVKDDPTLTVRAVEAQNVENDTTRTTSSRHWLWEFTSGSWKKIGESDGWGQLVSRTRKAMKRPRMAAAEAPDQEHVGTGSAPVITRNDGRGDVGEPQVLSPSYPLSHEPVPGTEARA